MTFKLQRDTLIGLIVTGLHYINDREVIERLNRVMSDLCDLWCTGYEILDEEEERQIYLLSVVLQDILNYLD